MQRRRATVTSIVALAMSSLVVATLAPAGASASEDVVVNGMNQGQVEQQLATSTDQLEKLTGQVAEAQSALGSFARQVYTDGGDIGEWDVILNSRDLGEITEKLEAMQTVSRGKNRAVVEFLEAKAALDAALIQLEEQEAQAERLRAEAAQALQNAQAAQARAEQAKVEIDNLIRQRNQAVTVIESQRSAVQSQYNDLRAAQDEIGRILAEREAERLRREAEERARAEAEAARQREIARQAAEAAAAAAAAAAAQAAAAQAAAAAEAQRQADAQAAAMAQQQQQAAAQAAAVAAEQQQQARQAQQQAVIAEQAAVQVAAPAPASSGGGGGWVYPTSGSYSSPPGPRQHPAYGYWACHMGEDIAASSGTPIYAASGGTVISAGYNYGGYGLMTIIDHGGGITSVYAHQSGIAVGAGSQVGAGQVIGYVGSTGDSTGPHLHFEIRVGGTAYLPSGWYGGAYGPVPC